MTGFTKGPWFAGDDPENNDMGKLSVHTKEGFYICLTDKCEAEEANAHLIAAAPDMYEALKVLLDPESGEIDRSLAMKDARAAVRKAEGQS